VFSVNNFSSGFAVKLDAMLDYRAARGYKRETYLRSLIKFDGFCVERFPYATELTREIVHAWVDSETISPRGLTGAAATIRQFGKYLNAVDEEAYILPDKFAPSRTAFVPYNFTDDELSRLFREIDRLPPDRTEPFLCEIAPVLLRLIYTCGLRPNEGRELLTGNINIDSGEILIKKTKRKKERIVVMSDDMAAMCRLYDTRRNIFCNNSPYFFPANDGNAIGNAKILAALNKAWTAATCTPQNPVPRSIRVYDLRHRFASVCLNRWLDEGKKLMAMLPYLRTYMGHGKLSETAYYIHILPENLIKSPAIDWNVFNAMFPEVTL
jgi:integrase